jgi:multidrug efflux pump subunit AcrA (membrane-fusion protein)
LSRLSRALLATRKRKFLLLGGGIALLVVVAAVLLFGGGDGDDGLAAAGLEPVPVEAVKQPFSSTIVLQGVIDTVPATPLTGVTAGSEVRWLVPDGARVKQGDPLYRELGADDSTSLEELRRQQQQAATELGFVQQGTALEVGEAQGAIARANEARTEAGRRLEAAGAEGDAAVAAAEQALAETRSREGVTDEEVRAAEEEVDAAHAQRTAGVNEARGELNAANEQVTEAAVGLTRSRIDAQRQLAEVRQASEDLAAKVRRAQSGVRDAAAQHDGVVRIRAGRVPEGDRAADRIVGELEPPGFVLSADVDPILLYQLPDPIGKATVNITRGPPEFACDKTELATVEATQSQSEDPGGFDEFSEFGPFGGGPSEETGPAPQAGSEVVVRCFVPSDQKVFVGLNGELKVVIAELSDALVVPAGAVQMSSGTTGTATVIEDDGTEEQRDLELGPSDGAIIVVTKGLSEGEKVLDRIPNLEGEGGEGFEGDVQVGVGR